MGMVSKDGLTPLKRHTHNPIQSEYSTLSDISMIHQLLLKNPRYNIPEYLRNKIIATMADRLDDDDGKLQIMAAKVLLEADKRNIDLVKLAIPQKKEIKNVTTATTEELQQHLKQILLNNPELVPVEVVNNASS